MKMRWYDRILVSLSGLVLIVLGVIVMLAGGGVIELPGPLALDRWLGTGWRWMPLVFLAGLLLIAWGLWLLLRPMMRRDEKSGRYYTVHDGGEDSVHISVQALDHLVHKCLDRRDEILSATVKITGQEDAMRILLRMTVRSGIVIPSLVAQVRSEIKRYVEQCAGVTVESVRIVVEATKEAKGEPEAEALPPASGVPASVAEPFEAFAAKPVLDTEPIPQAEPVRAQEFERARTVWTPEPPEPPVSTPEPPEEAWTFVGAETELPEAEPIPLGRVLEDDIPDEKIPLSSGAFPFPGEATPVWNPSAKDVTEDTDAEEAQRDE